MNLRPNLGIRTKLRRLRQSPVACIKLFLGGTILFALGFGTLVWAAQGLPGSLRQELIALAGIITGGIGFFCVIVAQLHLILYRFNELAKK